MPSAVYMKLFIGD